MIEQEQVRLLEQLHQLLDAEDAPGVARLLGELRPEDTAALLREVDDQEVEYSFEVLSAHSLELAAEVLSCLDRHDVARVLRGVPDGRAADILELWSTDDATWALELLPDDRVPGIVAAMDEVRSRRVQQRLDYPEGSAGRLMSDEYISIAANRSAGDAIERLRRAGEEVTIIYVYLVDKLGRLVGVVSIRHLLRVPPERKLIDLSAPEPVSASVLDDQEQVARVLTQYDWVCLPVVDARGRLVGVVTHDDVMDVLSEEATEDTLLMAGTTPEDVIAQSVWRSARIRTPWLFFSLLGGLVSMKILDLQEARLGELFVVLAVFIPVIVGMGGNLGTQAATLMVRGLATGRLRRHDALPVFWRELRTAFLIGTAYGLLLTVSARLLLDEPWMLCLVVGGSLVASMLIASAFGTLLPIGFHSIGVDPAVATGPLVTTSMDIIGILTYLGFASWALLH